MFEKVNPAHPDKIADRIAGAIVDLAYAVEEDPKIAVEVLIGHGVCHTIIETTCILDENKIRAAIKRIAGNVEADIVIVKQDEKLTKNQQHGFRCGDNGIFKGAPLTKEQVVLVEAAQSIWVLSPAVILVCIMSACRGYAEGHSNMLPTSISQVIEVAVKVGFGLVLAFILSRMGKSLPILAAAAVSGVTIGSLAAAAFLLFTVNRQYHPNVLPASAMDVPEPGKEIFLRLIKIGIPIALGASVSSLMTLIDSNLALNRLQGAAGFTYEEAKTLYGVYAKALTLYNLPAAFITPLTVSIVPAISRALAAKKRTEAKNITESSLKTAHTICLLYKNGLQLSSLITL